MSSHRRPAVLAAAVLTAATLGTAAFVIPATAADGAPAAGAPAAAAPIPVTGGTLDWGVLGSLRAYVKGIGSITTHDGASEVPGGFRFGQATGQYDEAGGHVVTAAFKGRVVFDGTAHGFVVAMENFRINTGTKKLTADVTRNNVLTRDVPLADVAFTGKDMTGLTTTLTREFAAQFDRPAYAGQEADKLSVALEFPKPPAPSDPPGTSPSPSAGTTAPTKPTTPSSTVKPSTKAPTTAPADGPQKILRGKLTWGLKQSLHDYVGDQGVTASGGATKNGKTFDFSFGKGELDVKNQKLNASFEGAVRFELPAHHLDLAFSNVRIATTGKTGTLVLDAKTAQGTTKDIPFATLDLSKGDYKTKGGLLSLEGVPAVFTEKGSAVFAYNGAVDEKYKPGKPMDSLTLSVAVDKDVVLPSTGGTGTTGTTGGTGGTGGSGTTGGSTGGTTTGGTVGGSSGGSVGGNLASTGAEIPAGALLGTSGAVIAAGAGAVYLARRRRTAGN
ncbi:HtaA domain-containing protein [Streptomyces sp. AB3(2024)]|uniref:HtaA domain-containing protein n=1 Tax=Streptomyces sp. AB3(2024) TaxID=3317321 RepID=UPI0035A30720